MKTKIVESEKRISEKDLAATEGRLKISLPEDYRAFLLKHNGGGPEPKTCLISDKRSSVKKVDVEWFYAATRGGELESFEDIYTERVKEGDIPKDFLPIAYDPGGMEIGIGLSGARRGQIYLWNPEAGATWKSAYLIAESFGKFLNGLYDDPEDAESPDLSDEQIGSLQDAGFGPPQDCLLSDDLRENPDLAEMLVLQGANVNAKWPGKDQNTPLQRSAAHGNAKVCKLLIERGAKIDSKDAAGRTALHHAAQGGHAKVIDLLVEAGANVNAKDREGKFPIEFAKSAAIRKALSRERR